MKTLADYGIDKPKFDYDQYMQIQEGLKKN